MVARSARNALTLLLSKCRLRSSWEVLLRSYELKGTSRGAPALDVTPIFERTQRYSRHARASMPAKVQIAPIEVKRGNTLQ